MFSAYNSDTGNRSARILRIWLIILALVSIVSVLLSTLGYLIGKGTFLPWALALAMNWGVAIIIFVVQREAVCNNFVQLIRKFALSIALATIPITIGMLIPVLLFVPHSRHLEFWEMLAIYYSISGLCLLASALLVLLLCNHGKNDEPKIQPSLNELLQYKYRGAIIYLHMQDHYVRVVTTKGEQLLLMRMKDAVMAASKYNGLQVHRSYWVNRDYVESFQRDGSMIFLIMNDTSKIPVSRSFRLKVREAGLIK